MGKVCQKPTHAAQQVASAESKCAIVQSKFTFAIANPPANRRDYSSNCSAAGSEDVQVMPCDDITFIGLSHLVQQGVFGIRNGRRRANVRAMI